jgi:ZIP family zinc transporter
MLEAAAWALLAASSLVLGALIAYSPILGWLQARHEWRLGLLMAFGSGALVSAVAYDLVEEAVAASIGGVDVALGFALGAVTFFVGDELLDRWAARAAGRGAGEGARGDAAHREGARAGLAILLGAVLDGIPESLVIGVTLLAGGGVETAVVVAVFVSNVPESIASTAGLVGQSPRRVVIGSWIVVALASSLAAAIGYGLLGGASSSAIAAIQAFAAGAILVMLSDEMIPGAHQKGHTAAGLATALGFAVAALLSFST